MLVVCCFGCTSTPTPVVNPTSTCACYTGNEQLVVTKLPSEPKGELFVCAGQNPPFFLPTFLRFVDATGKDILYDLPTNTSVQLCNHKGKLDVSVSRDDKNQLAYVNANKASEMSLLTELVKDKTFCLSIGNQFKGTLYVDDQFVIKKHCMTEERAVLTFNGVAYQAVYDARVKQNLLTIILK